jgi:hypothetical protein
VGAAPGDGAISLPPLQPPDGSQPLDDYNPHIHRNVETPTT